MLMERRIEEMSKELQGLDSVEDYHTFYGVLVMLRKGDATN